MHKFKQYIADFKTLTLNFKSIFSSCLFSAITKNEFRKNKNLLSGRVVKIQKNVSPKKRKEDGGFMQNSNLFLCLKIERKAKFYVCLSSKYI